MRELFFYEFINSSWKFSLPPEDDWFESDFILASLEGFLPVKRIVK